MGGSGNHPANLMMIGRGSEFRVVIGLHIEPTVRCGEAIERSGEELSPVRGILVGSFSLRRASSLREITTLSIKMEAARNEFPRKGSTPETKDCDCKTYSVGVEGGKFGCGVPHSMAHGLINIAEIFSELY